MTELRAARTRTITSAVAGLAGLTVLAWVLSVRQMSGMDMGSRTELGRLPSFAALWIAMMAAMMLPGASPAVLRQIRTRRSIYAGALFVASYLGTWMLVGLVVYALYRPHGSTAAGLIVIAAGIYELTPVKGHFRRRCQERVRSGYEFGWCCVGSSIGLMALLAAVGVMSLAWMSLVAVVVLGQKLLPPRPVADVVIAVAILALGVSILCR
jgi:predicted metal-binding membrane protein